MCKVSVLVPCYNCKPYIRKCLDSLIAQTLKDIEIIVVDNVSTDGTREILKEYEDKLTVIYNEENIGQNGSMIKGLQLARGEYIAECDADDYVHPAMYARLYKEAKGADVVRCGFWDMWEGRKEHRRCWGVKRTVNPMKDLHGKERFLYLYDQPHIQSAIYKREFIKDKWYRPNGIYEDTSISFKIRTMAQKYVYIPDPLYYYRKDNPNSGTATLMNTDGIIEQFAEITRYAKEHNLDLLKEIGVMKFYSYRWAVIRSGDKSFWDKVRDEMRADERDDSFFRSSADREQYYGILAETH